MTALLLFFKSLWTFAKMIPWQVYAALVGIAAALWLAHAWAEGIRNTQAAKDAVALTAAQNQITLTQAANASADAAIKALQDKLAQCEAGRVADLDVQRQAQAAYKASIDAFKADDAAARGRTAKLLTTTCADWAKLPACGVTVQTP